MITYLKRNELITDILKDGELIGYVQMQQTCFEVEIYYEQMQPIPKTQKALIRTAIKNYVKHKDREKTLEIISEYKNSLRGFKTIA